MLTSSKSKKLLNNVDLGANIATPTNLFGLQLWDIVIFNNQ